jgi:hypothetical protein
VKINFKSYPKAIATVLCSFCLLVTGCASTATGSASSVLGASARPAVFAKTSPKTDALVVIRYPAAIENDAKDEFYSAFRSRPIGGALGRSTSELDSDQAAESVIVKSNYFAMSLYSELSKKLPANTVLLSPHSIGLGDDGHLTSTPIGSMEKIPATISVDFTAYTFPNPEKMMGGKPVTFGDLMSPLVVVHTDHRANAATHGLIMASAPMSRAAYGRAEFTAGQSFDTLQSGALEVENRPLDFISHLRGQGTNIPASHGLGTRSKGNSVSLYPMEKLRFDKSEMLALSRDTDGVIDPTVTPFAGRVANHIVLALNGMDIEKAGMIERAAAISRYDANLAPFTLAGASDPDYAMRYRMSSQLIAKERDVLAAQSRKIYEATYLGESGKQMREMLASEYQLLEQRRKIAKQQNQATALSILGAVAAVGVASSGNGSRSNSQAAGMIADLTTIAVAKAFALKSQSKAMGSNFQLAMAPVLSEQIEVQVDLLDGSEQISAASFAALQEKMQDLYSSRVRAIELVASECAFKNNAGATGRWLGECDGGVAQGRGVGTLKRKDGTAVEYYGQAANGLANGTGYMIVQDKKSPYSIEGSFVGGQANGPAVLSRSGTPTSARMYENGKNIGVAPSGTIIPRLYDAVNTSAELGA